MSLVNNIPIINKIVGDANQNLAGNSASGGADILTTVQNLLTDYKKAEDDLAAKAEQLKQVQVLIFQALAGNSSMMGGSASTNQLSTLASLAALIPGAGPFVAVANQVLGDKINA